MTRTIPEWIAKHDDQAIPARVKVRIFLKHSGRCAECLRSIRGKLRSEYDHAVALCNGGLHRESNLRLTCNECHSEKSKADVAEKSRVYRVRAKHIGVELRKTRPMPGSRASGLRKRMDGTVERRS